MSNSDFTKRFRHIVTSTAVNSARHDKAASIRDALTPLVAEYVELRSAGQIGEIAVFQSILEAQG